MKNIVLIFSQVMMAAITVVIVLCVYARLNRSMELQRTLPSIIEKAVANAMLEYVETPVSTDIFMREVVERIRFSIEIESDIMVDFFQCDLEKGIVALRVTAEFLYPNGKTGQVSCERCVLFHPMN